MTLLIESNLLHEGAGHLSQIGGAGTQRGGASQGQVVNEPKSAVKRENIRHERAEATQ